MSLDYKKLENQYEIIDEKITTDIINDLAKSFADGSENGKSDEEKMYRREKRFIWEVVRLKILTKMLYCSAEQYREEAEKSYQEFIKKIDFYLYGKKNGYNKRVVCEILLGEEYGYWKEEIERNYKCLFKRITEKDNLLFWIKRWIDVARKENENELAFEMEKVLTNKFSQLASD